MRRRIGFRLVVALGLLSSASAVAWAECRLDPGPQRTVTRVLDGETLVLDDASEVRLAGALAPRSFDADAATDAWPAAAAATGALAALTVGRTVVLGYTGSAKRDRQGRHVAQLFIVGGGTEIWVQGRMLSDGHARAYQQKDHRGCAEELLAHERVARDAGLGLWSIGAYLPRAAARTRDLEGMNAKFAVLRGRIAWVADGRETIALGFTPARTRGMSTRRGITVLIEHRDRDLLGTLGGDAKALEGRHVEVRGWLEQRLGRPPGTFVMDVSLAGMIIPRNAPEVTATISGAAPPEAEPKVPRP